jgi:hydrogenase nickel incorporation protein HypB
MCGTCGCSEPVRLEPGHHHHQHDHHGHDHAHPHSHEHAAGAEARIITLERDLLAKNDAIAAGNRARFQADRVLALNLVSSPGAGKTTLLVNTLSALAGRLPVAVIEGDQATSHDAERIRAQGVPAIQINTGSGCHLDAQMIERALGEVELPEDGVLFIENVGNLVCPAGFDLGEAAKVVIVSVTEGEDKPLKYPGMFKAARLMLISKCDLLPFLRFDLDRLIANARRVNPELEILQLAAETEGGLAPWLGWLEAARRRTAGIAA